MQNNAHPFPADATSRNRRSTITNAECPICSPLPLRRCDIAISHIGSRKHQNVQPNNPPLSSPTRYRDIASEPLHQQFIQYLTTSRCTRDPLMTSSAVQPTQCLRQQPEKPKKLRARRKIAFRSSRSRNRGSLKCYSRIATGNRPFRGIF